MPTHLFPSPALLPRLRFTGCDYFSGIGQRPTLQLCHQPPATALDRGPYSIAVVELDEGPRMMSNIVEVEQTPEALILDMPLEVVFDAVTDDITLVKFKPASIGNEA